VTADTPGLMQFK